MASRCNKRGPKAALLPSVVIAIVLFILLQVQNQISLDLVDIELTEAAGDKDAGLIMSVCSKLLEFLKDKKPG
jgi:hypothetical protein